MDIGIINPELIYPRGAEKQVCKLSYFLDKMGHEITIYTFEKADKFVFDPLLENVEIVSLDKKWVLNSHWTVDSIRWFNLMREISQHIKNHDIINAHNHPSQWISKFTDLPVVWTCNEPYLYFHYKNGFDLRFIHNQFDQYLSSKLRLILSLDNRMEEIISKRYSNPIKTVGSGVDLEREIGHIDNDYFDSIFVGPIHPQKRPLDIVKAFSRIATKIGNVRLHFVGNIASVKLKKEMEKISLANHIKIIFYGPVSDEKLYELYDIADMAVFVPELQPWGIFPLETITANIPTIISDQCGITDILPPDFPIVELGNTQQLSDKIIEIKENKEKYMKKINKTSKSISENYSWQKYSKKMFDIFNNVLNTE